MGEGLWIALAVVAVLLIVAALVVGLVLYRRRRISLSQVDTATPVDRSGGYSATGGIAFTQSSAPPAPERIDTTGLPAVGDDATIPRDSVKRPIADVHLPELRVEAPPAPDVVAPAPLAPMSAPLRLSRPMSAPLHLQHLQRPISRPLSLRRDA